MAISALHHLLLPPSSVVHGSSPRHVATYAYVGDCYVIILYFVGDMYGFVMWSDPDVPIARDLLSSCRECSRGAAYTKQSIAPTSVFGGWSGLSSTPDAATVLKTRVAIYWHWMG